MKRPGKFRVWYLIFALILAQLTGAVHPLEHLHQTTATASGQPQAESDSDSDSGAEHSVCQHCLAQAAFALALPSTPRPVFAVAAAAAPIATVPHYSDTGETFFIQARAPPSSRQKTST